MNIIGSMINFYRVDVNATYHEFSVTSRERPTPFAETHFRTEPYGFRNVNHPSPWVSQRIDQSNIPGMGPGYVAFALNHHTKVLVLYITISRQSSFFYVL